LGRSRGAGERRVQGCFLAVEVNFVGRYAVEKGRRRELFLIADNYDLLGAGDNTESVFGAQAAADAKAEVA
jgi:hypothetical protein